MQEWSNLARDDVWRLRKTPPVVSFLIGWLESGLHLFTEVIWAKQDLYVHRIVYNYYDM
jgi:hypothetical protein